MVRFGISMLNKTPGTFFPFISVICPLFSLNPGCFCSDNASSHMAFICGSEFKLENEQAPDEKEGSRQTKKGSSICATTKNTDGDNFVFKVLFFHIKKTQAPIKCNLFPSSHQ